MTTDHILQAIYHFYGKNITGKFTGYRFVHKYLKYR